MQELGGGSSEPIDEEKALIEQANSYASDAYADPGAWRNLRNF